MAADGFVVLCLELLEAAGPVRARRMFGGHGIYCDDLFVGLILQDRLYLKVDDATRADFAQAGCEPFVYAAKGREVMLSFWSVPDEALDSPAVMLPWARRALAAALRARAAKPPAAAKGRATRVRRRPAP